MKNSLSETVQTRSDVNNEYHKVIGNWAENSSDLNISEHIGTIIKNEVAKKWCQKQNIIVFAKTHRKKTDCTCFDKQGNKNRVIWHSFMFIFVLSPCDK